MLQTFIYSTWKSRLLNFIFLILYFGLRLILLQRAVCLFISLAKQRIFGIWKKNLDFKRHIRAHLLDSFSWPSRECKVLPACKVCGCLFLKTRVTKLSGRGSDLPPPHWAGVWTLVSSLYKCLCCCSKQGCYPLAVSNQRCRIPVLGFITKNTDFKDFPSELTLWGGGITCTQPRHCPL